MQLESSLKVKHKQDFWLKNYIRFIPILLLKVMIAVILIRKL